MGGKIGDDRFDFLRATIAKQARGGPRCPTVERCFRPTKRASPPIGRVAVAVRRMNLPHQVEFRQKLLDEGVFEAS